MGTSCCWLFLVVLLIRVCSELVDSKTDGKDIQALRALKKAVDPSSIPPGSCLSSWDFSLDPCDHIFTQHFTCGFRCDPNLTRVTEITLDRAGYTGSLSSPSWNLPYLQTLDLSENLFFGSIPSSLSNLTSLRVLALSSNAFTGEIPFSIGLLSNLEELYLNDNRLRGGVPVSLNGLLNLQRLELQNNNLTGELPSLTSLKTLSFFDASGNGISGGFSTTVLPSSIVEISMRNNQLDGYLDLSNIFNLNYLQVMDLSQNKLSGCIPSGLFDGMPSLQQLTLSYNKFKCIDIPSGGVNNSQLIAVDLSNNQLRGLLPSFMAMMPTLSALSVENNSLTGMIPSQYALKTVFPVEGTSAFARLLLGGNYLFGPIPGAFMGLKPGSVVVSLVDNCLYRCPPNFFFCQGRLQKSVMSCKRFGPLIP